METIALDEVIGFNRSHSSNFSGIPSYQWKPFYLVASISLVEAITINGSCSFWSKPFVLVEAIMLVEAIPFGGRHSF